MQNARENLHGLWRSHKGLMLLLVVGLAISLLAVLAPQAWATPGQSPLRQTTDDIEPDKPVPDCYRACDEPVAIQTTNEGFSNTTLTVADVYVTENITWFVGTDTTSGTLVSDLTVVHQTQVTIGPDGHFTPTNPVIVWYPPLTVGYWDVFFDVNRDGELNNDDAVLLPQGPNDANIARGAGICVDPCAVGGASLPRAGLDPRWFALLALVGGGAGAALIWKRRRD